MVIRWPGQDRPFRRAERAFEAVRSAPSSAGDAVLGDSLGGGTLRLPSSPPVSEVGNRRTRSVARASSRNALFQARIRGPFYKAPLDELPPTQELVQTRSSCLPEAPGALAVPLRAHSDARAPMTRSDQPQGVVSRTAAVGKVPPRRQGPFGGAIPNTLIQVCGKVVSLPAAPELEQRCHVPSTDPAVLAPPPQRRQAVAGASGLLPSLCP